MFRPEPNPVTRLRVASDSLLSDLELLQTLEEEKRTYPPESPRFGELARQIEELATRVLAVSSEQRATGEELAETHVRGAAIPLADAPSRPINVILAEWRDAERRLEEMEPESLQAAVVRAEIARLRAEYQRAHRTTAGATEEAS